MTYYLVSYSVYENHNTIINGGIIALESDKPKTISDIQKHFDKFYAGPVGLVYLNNIQKITEDDYYEYGGHEVIS